jgi:DNA-binding CsgD family transcriptional regulator
MTALTGSDYRGALDVLRVAHEADDRIPFSGETLAALRRLIPSAIATSHEWDPTLGYRHVVDGADTTDVAPLWSLYWHVSDQDPFPARPQRVRRVAPLGVACRFSDVLSLRQFHRLDLHAEICRPLGINHVMKVFFAVGETGTGYLVLDSQRRAFSDRDRAVLDVLAPHLALVRQRCHRLADPSLETLAATALLSAREGEILRLVASGMTNREIAACLFVAPGTVRKHLDNIYAKLGVRSRAQAVAVTVAHG